MSTVDGHNLGSRINEWPVAEGSLIWWRGSPDFHQQISRVFHRYPISSLAHLNDARLPEPYVWCENFEPVEVEDDFCQTQLDQIRISVLINPPLELADRVEVPQIIGNKITWDVWNEIHGLIDPLIVELGEKFYSEF